jgi:hypothetical protein
VENNSQPINSAKAARLLSALMPAVARVELYPHWSDGGGETRRRTEAIPYDAGGRIIDLEPEVRREVCAVLRRLGDVDLDRPQWLSVPSGAVEPVFPVVMSLPEALGDDHDHVYRYFGPHAGRRCVSCNRPWFMDGSGEVAAVDSYRAAQLVAQRHELEDPAEPPLAVRTVVEPDPVRDCARSLADGHMTPVDWGDCDPQPAPARETADVPAQGDAL